MHLVCQTSVTCYTRDRKEVILSRELFITIGKDTLNPREIFRPRSRGLDHKIRSRSLPSGHVIGSKAGLQLYETRKTSQDMIDSSSVGE